MRPNFSDMHEMLAGTIHAHSLLQLQQDSNALDVIALELVKDDEWPSGADFLEFVAERLRETGRDV